MKIVQVCPRYYPDIGGVETHVQEISERLVKQGYEVEIVCTDPAGIHRQNDVINDVKVSRFRSFAPNDAYFIAPKMYFYLKNIESPILHAHGYHAFPAFFAKMAAGEKKFIFTPHYHGRGHTRFRNFLLKFYDFFGKGIFTRADRIICVSSYEKQLIKKKFDVKEEKFICIPNGINFAEFINVHAERDPHKLLYIGRIEQYKGIQYIIEALARLSGFTLTIVGKGPYKPELEQLAFMLNVSDRITWRKDLSREELIREYKSAGVFISLSSFEAYGITVAEALVSGLQVIVNTEGALSEFIDGEMCIGIEPSAENLALAIRSLNGPTVYKKKIFDWDEVVEKVIETYSSS